MIKGSWKTTVAAIVAGIVAALNCPELVAIEPAWLHTLAGYLGPVTIAAIGLFARDNDKTSEAVGAK